ncbi:uncharacterized protein [Macaca nemestrina]|uniref:uncharacterized protein isoform X2 n=1 Tax=Macaca nemestrina TaxID=9545 RepID=UPI0039B96A63
MSRLLSVELVTKGAAPQAATQLLPRPSCPCHFPAMFPGGSGRRGEAEPGELSQAAPPGGRGHDSGSRRLPFRVPPTGDGEKMSVSGFKAKLKLLASIFHKNQEPQRRLMLHCNRTNGTTEEVTSEEEEEEDTAETGCRCHPGWSAVAWSRLTATLNSWVRAVLMSSWNYRFRKTQLFQQKGQ